MTLQREQTEYSRLMRDPSNGNLAVREVVDKRAPSLQAGAHDSARFDRALADYRQIVDRSWSARHEPGAQARS